MPEKYHITPYDAGWGYLVNFNHKFAGKEALLKISKECRTKVVTLIWDTDDCAQVYASQFRGRDVEPADVIDRHRDTTDGRHQEATKGMTTIASKVYVDDKMIGHTVNRTNDYYNRQIIAVTFIDKDYTEIGTEVKILWGSPGTPQYWIKAKVAEFPYYHEELRNETFNVEKIPHPKFN
jgi:glycine cleavage system aminomethyltransferase T